MRDRRNDSGRTWPPVGLGRESRYGGERDVTGACEGEGVGDVDLDEE